MNSKRTFTITLVVAILVLAMIGALLPAPVSAAVPEAGLSSAPQQAPPPTPPIPPAPGGTEPSTSSPGSPESVPPEPAGAPTATQALPSPESAPVAAAGANVSTYAISTDQLEVQADRGCPSQYNLNDPIQFIARRGTSAQAGYWQYMEIWNSTNGAWWSKLAADWVAPGGSLSRSGRIAEPTGQERLYSRLVDQAGNVIQEAWCEYSSSSGPVVPQIACSQTVVKNLALNEQHTYTFNGVGGRQVRISMTGPNGLDTYLELHAPDGSLVAANDDINVPYDLNSRMQVWLPVSGTYTIVARGFKMQAGQYSLSVYCN